MILQQQSSNDLKYFSSSLGFVWEMGPFSMFAVFQEMAPESLESVAERAKLDESEPNKQLRCLSKGKNLSTDLASPVFKYSPSIQGPLAWFWGVRDVQPSESRSHDLRSVWQGGRRFKGEAEFWKWRGWLLDSQKETNQPTSFCKEVDPSVNSPRGSHHVWPKYLVCPKRSGMSMTYKSHRTGNKYHLSGVSSWGKTGGKKRRKTKLKPNSKHFSGGSDYIVCPPKWLYAKLQVTPHH